jgi:uncharacterized membrane protein YgaE (UPF0421/DUF939 family)
MEIITSFWMALQVWPSRQGILLGIAAFLAILVLMPDRHSRAETLFNTILAMAIGFSIAHAVG